MGTDLRFLKFLNFFLSLKYKIYKNLAYFQISERKQTRLYILLKLNIHFF